MTGAAKGTVTKLLTDLGTVCSVYQDEAMRDLPCERVQCDEIWAFCYAKAKNVPADKRGEWGYGDVWTWVAMDADTKLVPSWLVAPRGGDAAVEFMAEDRAGFWESWEHGGYHMRGDPWVEERFRPQG